MSYGRLGEVRSGLSPFVQISNPSACNAFNSAVVYADNQQAAFCIRKTHHDIC